MTLLQIPDGTIDRRTPAEVRHPHVLHTPDAGIRVADAVAAQVRTLVRDLRSGERGGRGRDDQAWVFLEEESEVPHEQVTELLGGDEFLRGGLGASDGDEDFVRGAEQGGLALPRGVVDCGRDFREDG